MTTIRKGVFGTESEIVFTIDDDYKRLKKEYEEILSSKDLIVKKENYFINHIENKDGQEINRDLFKSKIKSAIVSVDIRNSTFLMDHSEYTDFASFISSMTTEFRAIVFKNKGVFDKFTGDGFICYFPELYSGNDFLNCALKTAFECHKAFKTFYENECKIFDLIMKEEGLGIGIDVGDVSIEIVANDVTIIGKPVVNACRLNSAPANNTYLNNKAYFEVRKRYPLLNLQKVENFEYKHIGNICIYKVIFDDFPKISKKNEEISQECNLPNQNYLEQMSEDIDDGNDWS